MAKIDVRKTELIWLGKYDEDGKLKPVEKPGPYPFQIVEVINSPRIGEKQQTDQLSLFDIYEGKEGNSFEEGWKNKLIWGDNKLVMSSLLEKFAGKINLIYIDPPFATGADFKFRIKVGEEGEEITKEHSIIEEKAYRDTWGKGLDSYLQMMYERLVLMKELLAENGSIYVHLDWHIGHYVKVMMDEIFGYDNCQNEIIWCYREAINSKKRWNRKHDVILFYTKTNDFVFNYKEVLEPHSEQTVKKYKHIDENGRKYRLMGRGLKNSPITSQRDVPIEWEINHPELVYRHYLPEGKLPVDYWLIDIINQASLERLAFSTQKPEALLKRIILASSNPGDLVADFFCGSGTTLAVAEKLGRRWIGCDLSRYAIHLTRKRLLEIEKSKDLLDEEKKIPYGKKAHPFEIINLGKYERQLWQVKTFTNKDERQALYEYLAFMLRLYGAEPISGFTNILHGKKDNALVYVGAVDSPVTIQEIIDAMKDCKSQGLKELHILGWEWEMGLNDAIQDIAKQEGIKLKLRIIPNEVLDRQAVEKGDVRFYELAHFKLNINKNGRKISVELKDFVIPHTDLIADDVKEKIKKWTDWIDYWAIDFNFQNDTFNNGWTSYRTKKDPSLVLKAEHTYDKPGKYKMFVKVIDIFGIDTSQIYEVEIE